MKQNRLSPQGGDPINEVAGSAVTTRRHRDDAPDLSPPRKRRRKSIARPIVATAVVVAGAALAASWPDETPHIPAPAAVDHGLTSDELLADLVNRGLVPVKAIDTPDDALLRDLVNRGLIPRQAMND